MKIAYIVLAHKHPEQLVRLINRLNTKTASFFIHIDRKIDAQTYTLMVKSLKHFSNIYFYKRYPCYWGDFGLIKATIKGIQELIKNQIDFDYAILLTGQDYPLKSNDEIEDFFRKNNGKLFLKYFPIPNYSSWPNERGGLDRIQYWHFRLLTRRFRLTEENLFRVTEDGRLYSINRIFIAPFLSWLSLFPIKRKFPQGFEPFGGRAYWCFPKDCVKYIANFVEENPRFVNFFKNIFIPDEIFFQTLILSSPWKYRVVNDSLRFIKWSGHTPHPNILTTKDFEEMAASSNLFARKFDLTIDAKVLDLIDQKLLTQSTTRFL